MKAYEIERELSEDEYDRVLEDIFGRSVMVCGMDMYPPNVLKEMDPTAYRCGKVDYEDSLERLWACGECDTEFEDEGEAEECCTPDEDESKPTEE